LFSIDKFFFELKSHEFYVSLLMQQDSFVIWISFAQYLLLGYLLKNICHLDIFQNIL